MPLKYNVIIHILRDYGFIKTRSNGSHFRYEKNGYGLTVGFHDEYPPKTAKSMLKDIAKISDVDYVNLVKDYKIKL